MEKTITFTDENSGITLSVIYDIDNKFFITSSCYYRKHICEMELFEAIEIRDLLTQFINEKTKTLHKERI